MPLTTLIFVRHAQSLHPHADDRTRPLTEAGLRDRSLVLETLKERQIDAFLCSPYKRSMDTIQTTADYFGMEIKTDERFRERESGSNASQTLEKRWADFSFAEEGGENLGSVQNRNMEALKEALQTYAGKTIVIGTHGTALSTILHYYDSSFGVQDFRRILNWMPYILELTFDGDTLLEKKELAHVDKSMDAQKMYELAMKHIYGDGVPEDNALAAQLLENAHAMGHREAGYNLGICYHYGYGTPIDLARAFALYLEAAKAGHGKGMELVGRFYNRGIYVERNREKAEYWLSKAMESDDADAVLEAKKEYGFEG